MFRCKNPGKSRIVNRHSGLSLMELLIAVSIMSGIAASIGALALAVQASNEYSQSNDLIVQHGRVALQRMRRTIHEATYKPDYPGFASFSDKIGPWKLPDTLVIWHPQRTTTNPQGIPANSDGPPLFDELIIFSPDTDSPNRLLEVTFPGDKMPVPAWNDMAFWSTELASLKTSKTAKLVVLTDCLYVGLVSDASLSTPAKRGAVRFLTRPTREEWDAFNSDSNPLTWENVYGQQRGVRKSWCEIEFLLEPKTKSGTSQKIPFIGSAAIYFQG